MAHRADRSRIRTGHPTATGPVTPTCSWDRWGRAETERTALGEALVMRRRTRVRFPPPPPRDAGEEPASWLARSRGHREQRWPRLSSCLAAVRPHVVRPATTLEQVLRPQA